MPNSPRDTRLLRISRELFLAGFGVQQQTIDFWVIDRLTSLLDEEDVQTGQILATAGEALEYIYFMQDGSVQMTREGAAPWTFQGRWLLGAFEAHLDRPLVRTAVALADFRAMKIRPNAWLELLEDSFLLARASIRFSSAAVARLEERVPGGLPSASPESTLAPIPQGSPTVIERLAFLAEVEMLRGAGVQPLAELAVVSRERIFAAGELLFERGSAHQQLFIVMEGEVLAKPGDSEAVWRYGPRDLVCGAASFSGAPDWQAKAGIATRTLSFPLEVWFELMDEHFDLVRAAVSALALRREALMDHLAEQTNGILMT
jgi:CRP-like cAMP-binding protein